VGVSQNSSSNHATVHAATNGGRTPVRGGDLFIVQSEGDLLIVQSEGNLFIVQSEGNLLKIQFLVRQVLKVVSDHTDRHD